jgi:hypothetical protein
VISIPFNSPDRTHLLNNLGYQLGKRFERTHSEDDLNRAVEMTDAAVSATPFNHPERAGRLDNLGYQLGMRFELTGSVDDLNRAVDVAGAAVVVTPANHPEQASRLENIGNQLEKRFKLTGSKDDLDRALSSYKSGWCCLTALPSIRINLARRAAGILALQSNWEEASLLLREL